MMRFGKASIILDGTTRIHPASTIRSGLYLSKIFSPLSFFFKTRFGILLFFARMSPCAFGEPLTTSCIFALRTPLFMASMIACKLLPVPAFEIRTTILFIMLFFYYHTRFLVCRLGKVRLHIRHNRHFVKKVQEDFWDSSCVLI